MAPPWISLKHAQVHVAEDLVRLERLVAAADQHGVGVVADELEPLEIGDDRGHHQREHPPAAELADRGARRRLDLRLVELEADPAQLARRVCRAAASSCWSRNAASDRRRAACHRLDGAGDGLTRDVEHAVDVEENAGHRRAV